MYAVDKGPALNVVRKRDVLKRDVRCGQGPYVVTGIVVIAVVLLCFLLMCTCVFLLGVSFLYPYCFGGRR